MNVPNMQTLPPKVTEQITDLLARNNKIEAIKVFRQATGLGLKESMTAVNGMEAAMASGGGTVVTGGQASAQPTGDTLGQVALLMKTNQKIQAIKVLREASPIGLKEAKDAVEALEKGSSTLIEQALTARHMPVSVTTNIPQPSLLTVTEVKSPVVPFWVWIIAALVIGAIAVFILR